MAASDESFPNSRDFFCSRQVSWLQRFFEEPESVASIIKGKLMTKEEGILTNPLETNHAWTNCFNGIPNFGFPDIYNYLVGECSYSQES